MSVLEITIRLATVAVLASYLYAKQWQRVRRYRSQNDPAKWTGAAIDPRGLKERVDRVRHDHLAARSPAAGVGSRRPLLGAARRTVARLAYFRDREAEEHQPTQAP